MEGTMPAAVLERGTTSRQRKVVSDVAHLVESSEQAGIKAPAIIVVGEVCTLEKDFEWAEKRILGKRQFLITRPKENGSALAERLRACGAQVLEVPAIVTHPIEQNEKLKNAVLQTGAKELWIVFSSPIGVRTFFEQLLKLGLDARSLMQDGRSLKIAVIGSATGKELRKFGFCADVMPAVFNAKELGEKLAKEAVPESRIVIARAKEGSKELLPPLQQAGLEVEDIPIYETDYEVNEILNKEIQKVFEAGEIDAVTFTSASTVRGFVNGIKNVDYTKICAVCIGEQTAAEARKYGMQIFISKEASMDSMMELITEKFGSRDAE